MKSLAFLELAHVFSNQVKFPYSTACVWDYCRKDSIISKNYKFDLKNWFYVLDDNFSSDETVEKLVDIDILGVSYFVWNTVISDEICNKLKEKNPDVLIVYGGLGMPKHGNCEQFLLDRPYVDIIVHNEGELVFKNLLLSILDNQVESVKGITTRKTVNSLEDRIKNINDLPSPYLSGLFDELVKIKNHDYDFEAVLETTRGCPYTCTFCEIGDRFYTPTKKQSNQKIFKELDWVSQHEIDYAHIVDNNFGMYKEHEELTDYIIEKKTNTGYPNALNITWAKNKKHFLFNLAKKLNDNGLCKGVTIALQSLNSNTLSAIQRSNLDSENLKMIVNKLKKMKIPAYIELILGLPEESLESFKNGIFKLLDEYDYHNYVGIYPMTSLPNTPFNDFDYLNKYKIEKRKTSPAFFHHEYSLENLLKDENELVISTRNMSFDDYVQATLFKWFIISTHFLGWTRIISINMKKDGISFKKFYEDLYEYTLVTEDFLLYSEYFETKKLIMDVFERKIPWGRKCEGVSNIYWEYEEATSIKISKNKNNFYKHLEFFLKKYYNDDYGNLIQVQKNKMKYPEHYYSGDYEKWAKECLWWGRRNEKFFVGDTYEIL